MNELNLKGKVAVVTGGAGVICSVMAKSLAAEGVKIVILDLDKESAVAVASEIGKEYKTPSLGVSANVLDKTSLEKALKEIKEKFGTIDILVNGAGGNSPAATTKVEKMEGTETENPEETFFGLKEEGFDRVFDLNFKGTLLPTMVFAYDMVKEIGGHYQYLINELLQAADKDRSLFSCKSCCEQFHAMACRALIKNRHQGECHCTWIPPHKPEQVPSHRRTIRRTYTQR